MNEIEQVDVLKSEDVTRQDVRACRGCLATECKLYDLKEKHLDLAFGELTGQQFLYDRAVLCSICLQLLRKFNVFLNQCHSVSYTLQQIYCQNQTVNPISINTIDTKHIIKCKLIKSETKILSYTPPKSRTKHSPKPRLGKSDTKLIDIAPNEFFDIKENIEGEKLKEEFIDEKEIQLFPEEDNAPIITVSDFNLVPESTEIDDYMGNEDDFKPSEAESSHSDEDDFSLNDLMKKEKAKRKKTKKATKSKKAEVKTKTRKKKELKERSEDKKIIKEIGEMFKKMWRWKTEDKINIYRMFEKIHEESIAVKNGEGTYKCDHIHKKGMVCVKQELRIFLDYVKRLSELYNVEVEFLSVEGQKREIEDRRRTLEYQEAQYKCELCCKIFNFPDTYKRHMASHEEHPGDVECEICRYRFKRHASLMSHVHTMHSKKLKCRECGFVNRTWNLAKEHYDFHQGIAPVCHLCGKNFTERKHYQMHLRQVHRAQVATTLCLLCGDSFNGATGLRIHMDRSHRQAAKCSMCEGWFLNNEMLSAHLAAADGGCRPGQSSCPMCGANFSSEELMWQHHDEQHIKEYKCDECNKSYVGLRKYKWHVENKHLSRRRANGSEKPRKRPQDYKGNKNFVCDICGKDDFPFLSSLRFHQRKHTDEKPYECTVCRKTFKEKLNLKVHMTIHTDERRYQCPYCPKAFRQFSHRTVHIRTHTKEKPYSCSICSKQFSHRSVMLEHVRTVHEGHPPRRKARGEARGVLDH